MMTQEEKIKIEKIWNVIGLTTLAFFLGLLLMGSLMIYWNNNQVPETAIEQVTRLVKENPEMFYNSGLIDSILQAEGYHRVTATVYNPVEEQCDDDPLITADCSRIDLERLDSGELKWIALSRDLLEKYDYGDRVEIICLSDSKINGIYEIHDTMNRRFTNKIDILMPNNRKVGKWDDVIIKKIEE